MHIFDLPIRNTLENACFEELANLRRIGALRTIRALRTISGPPSGFCFLHPDFVFFREKKQNVKISHENEGKNRRPKRAPIVRGAKAGANYAEFGSVFFIRFFYSSPRLRKAQSYKLLGFLGDFAFTWPHHHFFISLCFYVHILPKIIVF